MMRIYKDALGNWIVATDDAKYTGFATELDAERFTRSLRMTVAQEYLNKLRDAKQKSEELIDSLAPASRLRQANNLDELIMNTPDDEFVPGTDMLGAYAKKLLLMYGGLNGWLNEPVTFMGQPLPGEPTPLKILSERE